MEEPGAKAVTSESVEAMAGALESVARLNHISRERRSFRHGSIAHRQHRLARLVGLPLDRLPIDRTCRWIKGGIVAGVLVVLMAVAAEGAIVAWLQPPAPMYGIPQWWSTQEGRRPWRMRVKFVKMHGCGNDYVYLDGVTDTAAARRIEQPGWADVVKVMSDRHTGVGSDGVIVVCSPTAAARAAGGAGSDADVQRGWVGVGDVRERCAVRGEVCA